MSLADSIASNAEAAVASSLRRNPDAALDYSRNSLARVEEMLAEISPWAKEMTREMADGVVRTFGSYVLEVGRREFGGEYLWYEPGEQPVLVCGEPVFHVAMMALSKVRGRLNGDEADNIPFFYAGFAQSVSEGTPGLHVTYV